MLRIEPGQRRGGLGLQFVAATGFGEVPELSQNLQRPALSVLAQAAPLDAQEAELAILGLIPLDGRAGLRLGRAGGLPARRGMAIAEGEAADGQRDQ